MTPGPSQPPITPMYSVIGAFGKSSQHYIIKKVMASITRMLFMLVFHQSKCIGAVNRILFYYFHVSTVSSSSCMFLWSSVSMRCMLVPRALRVGVKTLHKINKHALKPLSSSTCFMNCLQACCKPPRAHVWFFAMHKKQTNIVTLLLTAWYICVYIHISTKIIKKAITKFLRLNVILANWEFP